MAMFGMPDQITKTLQKKNGVHLDNRFVVPHNVDLLIKYQAHINAES